MKIHSALIINKKIQRLIYQGDNDNVNDPQFDQFKNQVLAVFPSASFDDVTAWGTPTPSANHKPQTLVAMGCRNVPSFLDGSPLKSAIRLCKKYYHLDTGTEEHEILFNESVDPLINIPDRFGVDWIGQKYDANGDEIDEWNVYIKNMTKAQAKLINDRFNISKGRNLPLPIKQLRQLEPTDSFGFQFRKSDLRLQEIKLFVFARNVLFYKNNRTEVEERFTLDYLDDMDNEAETPFYKPARDLRGFVTSANEDTLNDNEWILIPRPDGEAGKIRIRLKDHLQT